MLIFNITRLERLSLHH
jgi:hypothetical protein